MAPVPKLVEPAPGFYPQPNDWTCGPYALKHALLALGRFVEAQDIVNTARSHWWSGTDEIRLSRAAREHECDLVLERRSDAEDARKELVKLVRSQVPVLLCVDRWEHWITVVGSEDRRFVIIDSSCEPTMSILTWAQLRKRWCFFDVEHNRKNPPVLYDLMAVVPRFRTAVKADFSVERVKFLRRPENQQLARHWNEYLEDLMSIGKPPGVRAAETVSMSEFLRRHQELLVTRSVYWHGDIAREEIERVLKHLRFVAETYGLVVPASATRRAVADLAMLVTLWACAVRGVDSMYGAPGTGPRSTRRRTIKRTVARAARVARVERVVRVARAARAARAAKLARAARGLRVAKPARVAKTAKLSKARKK